MPKECPKIIVLKLIIGCLRLGYLEFWISCIRAHTIHGSDSISMVSVTTRVKPLQ